MRTNDAQSTRILVVDDDAVVRRLLGDTLGRAGYTVVPAGSAAEALRVAADEEPGLAIVDLVLPDGDGIELLGQLKAAWPSLPAIVITAYVEPRSVVEAMRRGAVDYLAKPIDPEVLLSTCRAALARRPAPLSALGKAPELPIVGGSPETARIRETLSRLARTRAAGVLIAGERGTGKTWLAWALHAGSHRRQAPCLVLDCATGYAPVVALFGTPEVAGSGLLAATAGGTLVLDSVEALDVQVQSALLEWSERHRGGAAPLLVGLTTEASATGPLMAWLGRARIDLPTLADRTGDVLPLARHFLVVAGTRLGRTFTGFTPEAEHRLLAHPWPGNVRELRAVVEQAAAGVSGGAIRIDHLTLDGPAAGPAWLPASSEPRPLREIEDAYIDHVIAQVGGNKTRAAQLLGIARETLRSRRLSRTSELAGGKSA
jgi:DNA-binding NtrC family response regulator